MIFSNELICPKCKGKLKFYGHITRNVKYGGGKTDTILLERYICMKCKATHRKIPKTLFAFKHYERKIILGFLSGEFTIFNLEYEDYPCEATIQKWFIEYKQSLPM
ncbi:MAG: DUF6431 domain-containing protein [Oscillospiraceae bacterium]|jgi:ribosomal protein L40E|nr:DUF6431 domain-containing protein [Oscillospiraceae bacterium]